MASYNIRYKRPRQSQMNQSNFVLQAELNYIGGKLLLRPLISGVT
jgi:hypothetical protein